MFDWACLSIALILALNSENEFRAISFVLLAEFIFHKTAFIVGIQLTDYLEYSRIYLAYAVIQAFTIYVLAMLNSSVIPKFLIFINLGYNMLTISQYSIKTIDFYTNYKYFVGAVMILELIYLAGCTRYAGSIRGLRGVSDSNFFRIMFRICRRVCIRLERGIAK